jgi:hypothetical protein
MTRIAAVSALIASIVLMPFASAQEHLRDVSGTYYLRACQLYVGDMQQMTFEDQASAVDCLSVMKNIGSMSLFMKPELTWCPPEGVTWHQLAYVAIEYLWRNPAKMQMPFFWHAIVAWSEAWPCKP